MTDIKIIPVSEFDNHAAAWDSLNKEGQNTTLLEYDFISTLIKYFGSGKELLVQYSEDGSVKCMAVIVKIKPGVWQTFQPSQAPIGSLVISKSADLNKFLDTLISRLPGFANIFGITQQDPDLLIPPISKNTTILDYIQTARVTVNSDFESYWSARGKNLRHNLNRQKNRLSREDIETSLQIIAHPEDVENAVRAYGDMEEKSWKAEGGTAISINNVQGKFYRDLLKIYAQKGRCHIYKYLYNDIPVAIDLCISGNKTIFILKTTYDEAYAKSSPAMLMRKDAFEDIFDNRKYEKIEFYGKVMDWHTKWSDEIRTMYHINYFRYPLLKKLLGR